MAVRKPSGLLTHASTLSRGEDSLMRMLRDQIGHWLWPLHRLDRGSSGLVLFALEADTARSMALQFREHRLLKQYLAIVRGWPPGEFACERPLRDIDPPGPERSAHSRFTLLASGESDLPHGAFPRTRGSLLRCRPVSGRPHQLRRHLAGLGWPILGDRRHGDHKLARTLEDRGILGRLALVCTELRFNHPTDDHECVIQCGIDMELATCADNFGLKLPPDLAIDDQPSVEAPRIRTRAERRRQRDTPAAGARLSPPADQGPALRCPLCGAAASQPFHQEGPSRYWSCPECRLIHMHPEDRLDREAEAERYQKHENRMEDPGYRRWLEPACDLLTAHATVGSKGLDIGCGPAPLLASMLSDSGRPTRGWDPLFHPQDPPHAGEADLVSMTEVFEHLHQPLDLLRDINRWARPAAHILVMTGIADDDSFAGWHYLRDRTHVIFARPETMEWIGASLNWRLVTRSGNLVLFRKEG